LKFEKLFNPKTIAVIGISLSNDRHPANVIYNKIHLRYPVQVYAVNPVGVKFKEKRSIPLSPKSRMKSIWL